MNRARASASVWCLFLCVSAASVKAGTVAGEFRLTEGHSGRRELAFTVNAPGPIQVRVESDTPGVAIQAMLIHHTGPVFNAQGGAVIQYDYNAPDALVSKAREWAVRIHAVNSGQLASGRIFVNYPDGASRASNELEAWLEAHPAVPLHLRWVDARGSFLYSAWPRELKDRLWQIFDQTRRGTPPSLPDPPRNAWVYRPGENTEEIHTLLSPEDATDLYLATVAHSLAVEMDRRVPWSLDELNDEELDVLFSSTSLFWWNAERQGYKIVWNAHGWAVPAPPQVAWQFLQEQRLLGRTRLETIVALLGWCKGLVHFGGAISPQNFTHFWGYPGDMPVSRALSGTSYTGEEFRNFPGFAGKLPFTAGCHGTVGLLVSVLRAANIPVKCRVTGDDTVGHATAIFLSEDKGLTHGDDPYSQLAERAAPEELLVDLATYNAWLGPMASNALPNIGRQTQVLALRRLSRSLRVLHERDKANGVPRQESEVYSAFKTAFSFDELQAARLWERLDEEIAAGPATAPSPAPAPSAVAAVPAPAAGPAMREKDDAAAREMDAKERGATAAMPVASAPPASVPPTKGGLLLEAETLKPAASGGHTQEQPMTAFTTGKWSGDQQLWWTGGKAGDTLTLTFAVNAAGVYRLAASFTRAPDYGMVSVTVDGAPTRAEKLDLYDTQVTRTELVPLGEFKLDAGNHRLGITITGSNEAATPSYMVGLDELQFVRVD